MAKFESMTASVRLDKNYVVLTDSTGAVHVYNGNTVGRTHHVLFTDVDGVLTDGRVLYPDSENRARQFNVRDGHGVAMLQVRNVLTIMMSGENDPHIGHRAHKLHVPFIHTDASNKMEVANMLVDAWKEVGWFTDESMTFAIGDDLMDLRLMKWVTRAALPADNHPGLDKYGFVRLYRGGGHGAFREWADAIIKNYL